MTMIREMKTLTKAAQGWIDHLETMHPEDVDDDLFIELKEAVGSAKVAVKDEHPTTPDTGVREEGLTKGHVHVGTLRRGRVCWVVVNDGNGSKMKIIDQSPGGTVVDRKGGSRSFTTKDGKHVTIKSRRERIQISSQTVVEVNA